MRRGIATAAKLARTVRRAAFCAPRCGQWFISRGDVYLNDIASRRFEEEAQIGQKIKLGEQVLDGLARLGCPLRLQVRRRHGAAAAAVAVPPYAAAPLPSPAREITSAR